MINTYFTNRKNCKVSLPFEPRFGVVKISTEDKAYFIGCDANLTRTCMEINGVWAQKLGIGKSVRIEEVEQILELKFVEIEPVDEDSWELIESNSRILEDSLLTQIEIVQSGLIFPIWLEEGCLWMKVGDLIENWGILRIDSELGIKPKQRSRFNENSSLRNAPITEELECMEYSEGALLVFRKEGEIAMGVNKFSEIREGYFSWKKLKPFENYKVDEINIYKANQPCALNKKTLEIHKIQCQFYVKIEENFENSKTVFYSGQDGVEIRNCIVNLDELLVFIVIDLEQQDYDHYIEFTFCEKPKVNLYHIESFQILVNNLLKDEILPFFEEGIPDFPIILQGLPGSGKSSIIKLLCEELTQNYLPSLVINCRGLSKHQNNHLKRLEDETKNAKRISPSILIIEDAEEIISETQDLNLHTSQQEKLNYLKTTIFLSNLIEKLEKNVKIIVSTRHVSSLNSLFLENFHPKEYLAPSLKFQDLKQVLQSFFSSVSVGPLASDMKSFQLIDLFQFCQKTQFKISALNLPQTLATLSSELRNFIPQALESKPQENFTHWEDIGGLVEAKQTITEFLEFPIKFSILYETYPLKQRSGLLLYGPPGCGKTLLASSLPSVTSLSFFPVKGPELLNKYIGASEQAVRDLFDRAKKAAPSIIFIDEFESIGLKRGQSSTGVTDRVVNEFLCELDGVEERENVYIVAASSRPEAIDAALLRPGRLDLHILLDFPNLSEREEIFSKLLGKIGYYGRVSGLGEVSENFTGADIRGIVNNLEIKLANEEIRDLNFESIFFETENFTPSYTEEEIRQFRNQFNEFEAGDPEKIGTKLALIES